MVSCGCIVRRSEAELEEWCPEGRVGGAEYTDLSKSCLNRDVYCLIERYSKVHRVSVQHEKQGRHHGEPASRSSCLTQQADGRSGGMAGYLGPCLLYNSDRVQFSVF